MMLSVVDVTVAGQTGQELFDVYVDDAFVARESAQTENQTFTYVTESEVSKVRIEFVNDFYDPTNGIDFNLIVDKIGIDGEIIEAEDPSVFGTGTWTGSAITPGFNQSEFIHANGYLLFDRTALDLTFAGYSWNRSQSTSASDASVSDNILSFKGGPDGASAIWTNVNFEANREYELIIDAWREPISGDIAFDGQPWVTGGVDVYDANWNFLRKVELQLFGPQDPNGNTLRTRQFFTPDGAAFGSIWFWGQATDANIPARIRQIEVNEVSNNDTSPPNIAFSRSPITEPTNRISFGLNVTDESGLEFVNEPGFEIRVDGPNGYSTQWNSVAGGPITDGVVFIYEVTGDFTAANNGEYFVTANARQFSDRLGNRNPEVVVGSFLIDIA